VALLPLPNQEIRIRPPPAGARAGIEGVPVEAPPSPVSLAQGGLVTTGDNLSVPDIEGVDPVEAIATAEAQDPGAGPPGPQAVEAPRPPQVEQSDITETYPHILESETQTLTRVQPHSLTLVPSEPGDREPRESGPPPMSRFDNIVVSCPEYQHVCDDSERQRVVRSVANPFDKFQPYSRSPGMPSMDTKSHYFSPVVGDPICESRYMTHGSRPPSIVAGHKPLRGLVVAFQASI